MPTRSSRQPMGSSAPVNGARRAPGLNFSNVLASDGLTGHHQSHDLAFGGQQPLHNSNTPFGYSRHHLLSLWNDKATADLPPDMAASLSALSGDLNNGHVNHHYHPAHLIISQESVGRPLGLGPLSAEEEKMYAAIHQSSDGAAVNGGSASAADTQAGRKTLNGGPAHASALQDRAGPGGTNPATTNAAPPAVSRRTSGNPLRSGGSAITGIQGGVLGSVTSGNLGRRGYRTSEGPEGAARLGNAAGAKGLAASEAPSAPARQPAESQGVNGAQSRMQGRSTAATGQQLRSGALSGSDSPPAHWDSEAEEEEAAPAVGRALDAKQAGQAADIADGQRPVLPSRPSLADLVHDSAKVETNSSRRSSAAASLFADDPLLRRRGFESSQPNSGSSTPDPVTAQLRNMSPALAKPPGLQQASPAKERLEDALWHYQDPSGTLQGPFKGELMQNWYEHSYFDMDLLVRRASPSSSLQPLGSLINQVGDRLKPFLTPLPSAQPAPALPPWSVQTSSSPSNAFATPSPNSLAGQADMAYRPALRQAASPSYDPFAAGSQYIQQDPLAGLRGLGQPQQQQTDPWGIPLQNNDNWTQQQQQQYAQYYQQPQHPQFDSQSIMSRLMGGQEQPLSPIAQLQGRDLNMQGQTLQTLHHPQPSQPYARFNRADSPATSVGVIGAPSTPSIKRSESVVDLDREPTPSAEPAPNEAPQQAPSAAPPTLNPVEQAAQAADRAAQDIIAEEDSVKLDAASDPPVPAPKVKVLPAQPPTQPIKGKSKGQQPALTVAEALAQQEAVVSPAPSSGSSKPASAPWATSTDSPERAVKSPSGPSLREIQAREAKQDEERRAATKRAKAAALASEQAALAAQAEQEANLPWANSKSLASGGAAAWTKPTTSASNANGTKKTLKEIQEEEEARQKKLVQQRQSTSVPGSAPAPSATRGYAGSLGPRVGVAPPSTPMTTAAGSGPWATVGSNGKANPPTAAKPGLQRAPSVASTLKPATSAPAPAKRPVASVPATPQPNRASSSVKATPAPAEHEPSLEFLEWTRSALKGLNIPIDDFITMLLTFPVQADSGTLEIISDAVYANSRTLDGRRFAEQFAVKRKADVGMSTKGKQPTVPPSAPIQVGGPPTAAQILQTKAKNDEALSFKVVPSKKGKKGGRS